MAGLCPSFPRGTVWNDSVYRDYVGTLVSPGKTRFFQCLNTIPEYRGFNSVGLLLGPSSKDFFG